jgi:cobalt-precorrin-5B (C1)-methyltransferase
MRNLRTGYSTGTCAAAAAKAAVTLLARGTAPERIDVSLPDQATVSLPVLHARLTAEGAEAAVRKDAGDDPDVTDGALVVACVAWADEGDVTFSAGPGVGTVTKPGLQVPPGEPAINPVPRAMIRNAVREVTERPVKVTVSIPGGEELARKTFNPRLGIIGGLSVLGTTGRVRPHSCPALRESLKCALNVAAACGVKSPVLVPGHIGERAARRHFRLGEQQVVEVGNEWGFILDAVPGYPFEHVMLLGHPGKLAKLAAGEWDTHSSRSGSAVTAVLKTTGDVLGRKLPGSPTTEGLFAALTPDEREKLANRVAREAREAVCGRLGPGTGVAVVLVNMQGGWLGADGELTPWK